MAFTAQTETIPQPALLLFAANIIWTIGYDTQYAMVDRKFDIKIGVKSTAIPVSYTHLTLPTILLV